MMTSETNDDDNNNELHSQTATTTTIIISPMYIQIEYCPGCKWSYRALWMAQELLYHYSHHRNVDENNVIVHTMVVVTVVPSPIAGTFRIRMMEWLDHQQTTTNTTATRFTTTTTSNDSHPAAYILWDRTIDIGFPDMYELYERIHTYFSIRRNSVSTLSGNNNNDKNDDDDDVVRSSDSHNIKENTLEETNSIHHSTRQLQLILALQPQPHISIQYRYPHDIFRVFYIGQELLSTFPDEIKAMSFVPLHTSDSINESNEPCTGVETTTRKSTASQITILLNDQLMIYNYTNEHHTPSQRFIPIKSLKQLIRDQIHPDKDLGHSDVMKSVNVPTVLGGIETNRTATATSGMTKSTASSLDIIAQNQDTDDNDDDDDDDDDDDNDDSAAAMARNYFGVA
jgi:predicted Rdx family selenoprotein